MNAENAPNERQSLRVCGLAKLNANAMNTTESTSTSVHRPYADSCPIGRTPVPAVTAMHEHVHERAGGHDQPWQCLPEMCAVLRYEQVGRNRQESSEDPSHARSALGRRGSVGLAHSVSYPG